MPSKHTEDSRRASSDYKQKPKQGWVRGFLGEWLVCAVLLAVSAGFFVGSFEYTEAVRRWPLILSSTTIILIVSYAAYRLWTRTFLNGPEDPLEAENALSEKGDESTAAEAPPNDRAILAAAASFVLFAVLAYGAGFLLASVLFIGGYMIATGNRSPSRIVGVVSGFAIVIYLLFGSTLNAPLTEGAWLWYSLEWLPV